MKGGMMNETLPDGWIEAVFGELNSFASSTINPAEYPDEIFELYSVPIFPTRKPEIIKGSDIGSTKQTVSPDDVLICKINPRINRVWKVMPISKRRQIASSEWIAMRAPGLNPDFLRSYFTSQEFREILCEDLTGVGGSLTRAQPKRVAKFKIPLAPLAEQTRIVDKLEAVLGLVDVCRARLERVPALLKRFRQSVLAAAISGKLTGEWRAANPKQKPWLTAVSEKPVSLPAGYKRLSKQSFKPTLIQHDSIDLPNGWCVQTVNQLYSTNCLIDFADGNHGGLYPKKEEFGTEGALFLTATQMDKTWGIALDECPRLNWKKATKLTKGWARNGDVLLSHNATVGRVGILEGLSEDLLLGTSVTFYRFNSKHVLPKFARIMFSSRFFQDQLESVMEQTTRDQVPITKQVSLNFICVPIDEQQEIVRRVADLLAFADRIEARLATTQKAVERLTPSILTKAFRGELVPQDPNDEPASELLERLRESAPTVLKVRRGRTAKSK